MKFSTTILILLIGLELSAQQLEVGGEILIKDDFKIATFQSTVKNSFISFATNDDPMRSTNVGYFDDDDDPNDDGILPYFFIDTPEPGFGEFIMLANGNVGIGTQNPSRKLSVVGDLQAISATASGFASSAIKGVTTGQFSAGVKGEGKGPSGIGVWGEAPVNDGWGLLGGANGSNGIGVAARGGLCDFDAIGTGTNYCSTSSQRWKRNVYNLPNPLQKLSKLRGVTFTWDIEHGGHNDIGFIAEEVGKILPQIVVYESNGIDASSMDYSMMTPLLVEAANAMRKEYQDKFEEQQSDIDALKQEMAELKTLLNAQINNASEN